MQKEKRVGAKIFEVKINTCMLTKNQIWHKFTHSSSVQRFQIQSLTQAIIVLTI